MKNNQGNASQFTFVESDTVADVVFTERKKKASKVIVYGKGDGENQIIGTAGSGIPVKRINDGNIVNTTEANNRATKELALIVSNTKNYTFSLLKPSSSLVLGDQGILTSYSVGLADEPVDIVKIVKGVTSSGDEFLKFEVANNGFRKANTSLMSDIARNQYDSLLTNSTMKGTSVTNEFGTGINADSTHPAKCSFYVAPELVLETGDLVINWLKVDYDIDPYNSQYGSASFVGNDPQVQNSSGDTEPSVTGTSGSETPDANSGTSVWTGMNGSQADNIKSIGKVHQEVTGNPTLASTTMVLWIQNLEGSTVTVDPEMEDASGHSYYGSNYSLSNNSVYDYSSGYSSSGNASGWFYGWDSDWNATNWIVTQFNEYTHTHGSHNHSDGSYSAVDHDHPDGSYDIDAADLSDITIGDSVSEAGSVNSTGATVYLDHWSGSNWVEKYSRVFGSDTLKNDIDMTDSGTYPDAEGYWRVRLTPNSANADFVNVKARLKIKIDN